MSTTPLVPEDHKHVLGLKLPTDPRWVDLTQLSIGDILTDHAYCEQKAATSCISLIQTFSECTEMVRALAPVVTEEWGHFRAVLAELDKRGLPLGRQRKDHYVNALRAFERKHDKRMDRVAERLIGFALIEARSCERFRLLSLYVNDAQLREFYHKFMVAEAGHYRLMIDLAALYMAPEKVEQRWQEYLDYEAEIMQQLEIKGDRIH
ncbi:tRNA-(ms[2]io[6]A)-hydroxylase [Rurimicrobium arvi]|uniref:tRNA-(Ms[2]io[6]A)-hydroxylase n=1 Tax=Rurimicrobium arvi TaxID=2049916 RepID=A0ABP8MVV4_9BACT